jgi:ABC-type oligopeptide transport system ATPase subunit
VINLMGRNEKHYDYLFEDAEYKKQLLKEYSDNPLIEALPNILEQDDVFKKIYKPIYYSKEERLLPSQIRIQCVYRLRDYIEPMLIHMEIESRISTILRRGYVGRNPLSKEFVKEINSSARKLFEESPYGEDTDFNISTNSNTNFFLGFSLIGISGIGKTTITNRILEMYPQVIKHSVYEGRSLSINQIVWLKVDCPFDGSLKALCRNFFTEVDKVLGTNYMKKFGNRNVSLDTMMVYMRHISSLHTIGAIFIDEIQHLGSSRSGANLMLNFFVTLVNTIGVPVILVGTFKAFNILQMDFRQGRRASGLGEIIWDRMNNNEQWRWFLEAVWKYQWTENETALTDEIVNIFYDETQGITDRAVILYMLVQWQAILTGKKEISVKLITTVAKEKMRLTKPMIDALKSNSIKELMRFDDIRPPDINVVYENVKNEVMQMDEFKKVRDAGKLKKEQLKEFVKNEVLKWLAEFDVDFKEANTAVNKIISQYKDELDLDAIKTESLKVCLNKADKKITKENTAMKRKKALENKDDLRNIYDDSNHNNISIEKLLVENDMIKDPNKEIMG